MDHSLKTPALELAQIFADGSTISYLAMEMEYLPKVFLLMKPGSI